MTTKTPTPKRKAEYSLQFYFDKNKTLCLMITSQGGDLSGHSIDFYHFGVEAARNDLLSGPEKQSFRSFCLGYINELDKQKEV